MGHFTPLVPVLAPAPQNHHPAVSINAVSVPFFDVDAVNRTVDVMGAFGRVVASKNYVLGREVKAFEAAFARYIGVSDCVGVGNGTDALELSLRALNVGPGSRVLLVANAAFYGSTAVHAVGAKPVYVDVSAHSACMDPSKLLQALAQDLSYACIIVTHLYGQMADMPAITALADAHGVPIVEDCAQAHGAQLHGRRAGAWGALGSFSFYPTKNLGALGDGGAVVSDDKTLMDRLRALRQYGWGAKYVVAHPGGRNSRLDELQAAVLVDKLPQLDAANARRRAIAQAYSDALASFSVQLPRVAGDSFVAHLFVVQVSNRDDLARALGAHGVQTAVHYPLADHLQPAYPCAQGSGALPVTENMAATVLSLPCHPGLDDAAVEHVVAAMRACMAEPRRLSS